MTHETSAMPSVMEGPGVEWRVLNGMEGMAAAYVRQPAGTDLTPMLKGLRDDLCQCPHWGYVIEGKLGIKYKDGSVDTITAGSVFYLPPGHTAWMEEDTAFIDFSPEKEYAEVVEHVASQV